LHRAGKLGEAAAAYRKILQRAPRHAEAHFLLGLLTLEQGNPSRAVQLFTKAAGLSPANAMVRLHLGEALRAAGRFEEAADEFKAALAIDPRFVPALAALGNLCKAQGRYAEAIAQLTRAAELAPGSPEMLSNLGLACKDAGKIEDAARHLLEAARAAPAHAEIQFNCGNVLLAAARFAEAEDYFRRAAGLDPAHVRAMANLGIALREQGRGAEAAGALRAALELAPGWADAHWNLALALLMDGKFAEGWREYEWRRRIPGFAMPRLAGPDWDGQALAGRRLLLRAEQGLGDTIQFARYARCAARMGGVVTLECQAPLVRLLSHSKLCDTVAARGAEPDYDVEAPLMSAPHLLDPELREAGNLVPYIAPEPELAARWRARLAGIRGFRIGICWQGNPGYRADRFRSVPLAKFLPLATIPGVAPVSLQKGFGAAQLSEFPDSNILDLAPELDNDGAFTDTAAVMANLDLVVTSDTAAAHLAGALGVPVFMALAESPDWRWARAGETTPWYPTMRLFRQRSAGDWDEVFARIAAEATAAANRSGAK
jgi:tetratricopeptide (TPR) repeat protein